MLKVRLTPECLKVNDTVIDSAATPDSFHDIFGPPSRIVEAGSPAPLGHRNHQIHLYDSLGVYLNEHHYTYQISAVTFVFSPAESPFSTGTPFSGEIELGSTAVRPGDDESALADCSLPFVEQLRGSWAVDEGIVWIGVDTKGTKASNGRSSSRRFVTAVHASLPHDPWDTRFRPP